MCQPLSFIHVRKAAGIEPRSEPDSGNPTVRDRRGAYGNVDYGSRTEARRETAGLATKPYGRARHSSIPTPLFRATWTGQWSHPTGRLFDASCPSSVIA